MADHIEASAQIAPALINEATSTLRHISGNHPPAEASHVFPTSTSFNSGPIGTTTSYNVGTTAYSGTSTYAAGTTPSGTTTYNAPTTCAPTGTATYSTTSYPVTSIPTTYSTTTYPTRATHPMTYTSLPQVTVATMYPPPTTTIQSTSYPATPVAVSGNAVASYLTTTGSLTPYESAIQNAINHGRVYAPEGSIYVSDGLARKSGIHTLYDSKVVPTFEHPVTFQSSTLAPLTQDRGAAASSHRTGKSKFIVSHPKKSACC